jgi:hypothetical protein
MTAAEQLASRALIASGLTSAEWEALQAGLKARAFWSARIESLRFLETGRDTITDLLANARNADGAITSRAQIVSDLMRVAREEGLSNGTGGLTDPGSAKRAQVIVDTQAGLARGYASYAAGHTRGARLAYPAWELIRIETREQPRDWWQTWRDKGGPVTSGRRMIALKSDPIWTAISRFGNPFPPFDYGSGMGVEDVSFEDCVALGVIAEDYTPPETSPLADFNAGLEADLDIAGTDDPRWPYLRAAFGDQIEIRDGKLRWRGQA